MNLYLLSQNSNDDFDSYNFCVVCAKDEEDAKTISPDNGVFEENKNYGLWVKTKDLIFCEKIGKASIHLKRGVIVAG